MNGHDKAGRLECHWTYDDEEDAWESECGSGFSFGEGGPFDNEMRFCCFCGAVLLEVKDEGDECEQDAQRTE